MSLRVECALRVTLADGTPVAEYAVSRMVPYVPEEETTAEARDELAGAATEAKALATEASEALLRQIAVVTGDLRAAE